MGRKTYNPKKLLIVFVTQKLGLFLFEHSSKICLTCHNYRKENFWAKLAQE